MVYPKYFHDHAEGRYGVAQGASGGLVGALAPHTPDLWLPKKQFQLESLLLAREFWPEVERISGLPTGMKKD